VTIAAGAAEEADLEAHNVESDAVVLGATAAAAAGFLPGCLPFHCCSPLTEGSTDMLVTCVVS